MSVRFLVAALDRLGVLLLHSLWQGAAIAVLLALAFAILRGARARHLAAWVALLALAVSPVATCFALKRVPSPEPSITRWIAPSSVAEATNTPVFSEGELGGGAATSAEGKGEGASVEAESAVSRPKAADVLPWRPAVGGLWLVGGAAMFLWRFCGWLWLRRLFSRAVAPPDWLSAMSAQIAARMRVAAPRLRLSDTAFGPALVGVLRPVLVFPAALVSRLQPWQFEAVLAHEIAHLRRFDPVWYFLQRCLEAAFFYHPAAWWICRQISAEREVRCDEIAAEAGTGGDRRRYAEALLALAESCAPPVRAEAALAALGETRGQFSVRMRRLMGVRRARASFAPGGAALAVAALLAAGFIGVRPAVSEDEPKVEAKRGRILDRHGIALTEPRFVPHVFLDWWQLEKLGDGDIQAGFEKSARPALEEVGAIKEGDDSKLPLHRIKREPYFHFAKLAPEQAEALERLRPVGAVVRPVEYRRYPLGSVGAHWIGFAPPSPSEGLRLVGRTGVEESADNTLARGGDVRLSIDLRFQMVAEMALRDAKVGRAAAVVVDPRDGGILAAASIPSFDPNLFGAGISHDNWVALNQDYTRPLIGRYHTLHTPGSAFNPVAALSAFHAGFVEKNYTCTGMVTLVKRPIRCWVSTNGGQHGELGLSEALACSCNAYFYRMAADLPPDAFLRGGEMLGIAGDRFRPVGIGNERVAAIPNPEWKLKNMNQPWSKDDAANVSIGQLATEVSPIQMAGVTASLANGASIIQPWLIAGDRPEPQGFVDYGIGEAQVGAIREGMWRVVNGEDGTGRRARSEIIAIAGKSGTAQRGRWDDRIKENVRDYNAWFIGFAPYDAPKYAICVMVENGKSGGSVAAPVARRILEQITQVESGAIEVKVGALPPAAGHFDFVEAVEF